MRTKNPKKFFSALNKSKHKGMLSSYSISDFDKMKLFKLKGYNIGYALKYKDGTFSDIVSVFNNEPSIKGIGDILIQSAISNGGKYLDHFDSEALTKLYTRNGFVEYDRDTFDPKYDEGGKFEKQYGKMDIVYRKLK